MVELKEKTGILQPLIKHRIYFLIVFSLGLAIGWNTRPLLEDPMVNFFSMLTAQQWLVLVTLAYVVLTFRLVNETKKAREQDRQRAIQRRNQEVESLRRALLAEVQQNLSKLEALDTSHTNMEFGGDVFYSDIYLNNTDRLGILTPSESESVVEAFTELIENQRLIRKGLEVDDDHGTGFTAIASSRIKRIQPELEQAKTELQNQLEPDS